MSPSEQAWLAGLLEGEGCFSVFRRKDRPGTINRAVHLEMTDEDVVRKAHKIAGVGTVCIRDKRPNRKPTWIWSTQDKEGIRIILKAVIPWLGQRRLGRALELLETCKPNT